MFFKRRKEKQEDYKDSEVQYKWQSAGKNINIMPGATVINPERISVGNDFFLGEGGIIHVGSVDKSGVYQGELKMGNKVTFNTRCKVYCFESIEIGNDVMIAGDVFITDQNHGMDARNSYRYQQFITSPVKIESFVWIGEKAIILPGVTVGEHSIIGGGAVVTKSVPQYSIVVGNPGRVVKKWNFEKNVWENVKNVSREG